MGYGLHLAHVVWWNRSSSVGIFLANPNARLYGWVLQNIGYQQDPGKYTTIIQANFNPKLASRIRKTQIFFIIIPDCRPSKKKQPIFALSCPADLSLCILASSYSNLQRQKVGNLLKIGTFSNEHRILSEHFFDLRPQIRFLPGVGGILHKISKFIQTCHGVLSGVLYRPRLKCMV